MERWLKALGVVGWVLVLLGCGPGDDGGGEGEGQWQVEEPGVEEPGQPEGPRQGSCPEGYYVVEADFHGPAPSDESRVVIETDEGQKVCWAPRSASYYGVHGLACTDQFFEPLESCGPGFECRMDSVYYPVSTCRPLVCGGARWAVESCPEGSECVTLPDDDYQVCMPVARPHPTRANFLSACRTSDDCGERFECVGGQCTMACSSDADCLTVCQSDETRYLCPLLFWDGQYCNDSGYCADVTAGEGR
jgi:hypothetical protein